ncbi:hypothetical protein HY498_01035 [Candidatus Woesearchaeota archaeon]|nr:hypothetical protein [Candidatus Woesearchaeota archaeon]
MSLLKRIDHYHQLGSIVNSMEKDLCGEVYEEFKSYYSKLESYIPTHYTLNGFHASFIGMGSRSELVICLFDITKNSREPICQKDRDRLNDLCKPIFNEFEKKFSIKVLGFLETVDNI